MPLMDDQKLLVLENLKSVDFFGSNLSLRQFSRNLSKDAQFGPATFVSIYSFSKNLQDGFRSGRHPHAFKGNETYDMLKKKYLAKSSPTGRRNPRPAASTKAVRKPTKPNNKNLVPSTPSAAAKETAANSNLADLVKTIKKLEESQDAATAAIVKTVSEMKETTVRFEAKLKEQSEAMGLLTDQNEKLMDVFKSLAEEKKKTTTTPVRPVKNEVEDNIQTATARANSVPRRGGDVGPPESSANNRRSARNFRNGRRATGFDDVFIDKVARAADLTHFPGAVRVKDEGCDGNVCEPAEEFNPAQQAHGRHEEPQD